MRPIRFLPLLLVLAACGGDADDAPKARLADTFAGVPIPPDAEGLGRESGRNAVQLLFRTPRPPAEVANYYRASLNQKPWRLISESNMPNGTRTFYAEQEGPPLWVNIRPDTATGGSFVDLAGAKVN